MKQLRVSSLSSLLPPGIIISQQSRSTRRLTMIRVHAATPSEAATMREADRCRHDCTGVGSKLEVQRPCFAAVQGRYSCPSLEFAKGARAYFIQRTTPKVLDVTSRGRSQSSSPMMRGQVQKWPFKAFQWQYYLELPRFAQDDQNSVDRNALEHQLWILATRSSSTQHHAFTSLYECLNGRTEYFVNISGAICQQFHACFNLTTRRRLSGENSIQAQKQCFQRLPPPPQVYTGPPKHVPSPCTSFPFLKPWIRPCISLQG